MTLNEIIISKFESDRQHECCMLKLGVYTNVIMKAICNFGNSDILTLH